MNNLTLQCKTSSIPHPEGSHAAVCLDVIDLGLVETEFQGQRKVVPKVKLVFGTEHKGPDGKQATISKNFTASLHPKAKLCEFLSKWRGRPVAAGEVIELEKLIGVSCNLFISHQQNAVGRTFASIDLVSKPTKKVAPDGTYDPAEMRQRIFELRARDTAARPPGAQAPATAPKPAAASPVATEFDPDVGF